MSRQFHNSEISLSESPLDIVEAHPNRTPEHWLLVTVSHDHAFCETLLFAKKIKTCHFSLEITRSAEAKMCLWKIDQEEIPLGRPVCSVMVRSSLARRKRALGSAAMCHATLLRYNRAIIFQLCLLEYTSWLAGGIMFSGWRALTSEPIGVFVRGAGLWSRSTLLCQFVSKATRPTSYVTRQYCYSQRASVCLLDRLQLIAGCETLPAATLIKSLAHFRRRIRASATCSSIEGCKHVYQRVMCPMIIFVFDYVALYILLLFYVMKFRSLTSDIVHCATQPCKTQSRCATYLLNFIIFKPDSLITKIRLVMLWLDIMQRTYVALK